MHCIRWSAGCYWLRTRRWSNLSNLRKPVVMCNTGSGGASGSSSSSSTTKRWNYETHGEVGEGCCQQTRRYEAHSYKQPGAAAAQARHSTAQASQQGAEGGGGVLTLLPIDVTDACMMILPLPSTASQFSATHDCPLPGDVLGLSAGH